MNRLLDNPDPVHRWLASYLRDHGYTEHTKPCETDQVVDEARLNVRHGVMGFGFLLNAKDLDREIRAIRRECEALSAAGHAGLYVLSGPHGWWYGNPDCAECRTISDGQDLCRIKALAQGCRNRRLGRETERRAKAGEKRIVQVALTFAGPRQQSLFVVR